MVLYALLAQYSLWTLYVFYDEFPRIADQYTTAQRMMNTDTCLNPWLRDGTREWHQCDRLEAFMRMPMSVRVVQAVLRRISFISSLESLQTFASSNQIAVLAVLLFIFSVVLLIIPFYLVLSKYFRAEAPAERLPEYFVQSHTPSIYDRLLNSGNTKKNE